MADLLNLNRARKAKARTDDQRRAEENRVRFGRSKAEKATQVAEAETAQRRLDGHKRE